jgi:hypothetical protein
MDENLLHILNESVKIISKLQLLSVFFEDEMIYKIYLRTQVIHQLFESNRELDAGKLELFHVQFTQTVIDLLRKVKQGNEKNVNLLYEEIEINRELIDKLNSSVDSEASYNQEKQRQALKVNLTLRKLYQVLSDNSQEYPFSRNVGAFSARYAQDFFYDITPELFGGLIEYNPAEVYSNAYATIHRKLLGQLNKNEFRSEFYCGLKAGNQVIEVYKFSGMDRYFLYLASGNLFLFFDPAAIQGVEVENTVSKKTKLMRELSDKNTRLQSNIAATKAFIPVPLVNLLGEYYRKISDIDFLQRSDFEIQANILRTMLNTDSI